jgi:hypothetical protein
MTVMIQAFDAQAAKRFPRPASRGEYLQFNLFRAQFVNQARQITVEH